MLDESPQIDELERGYASAGGDDGVETREVSAEVKQIMDLLAVDAEFFLEFFLAEELSTHVPEFHVEI